MAKPKPPDWKVQDTEPARSAVSSVGLPNTAHTRSCTDSMPWQLGPMTRTPLSLTARFSSASSVRPAGPVSRKPAVSTTAARMPALPQSRMASGTPAAGTATTARSHGASMADTCG